MPRLAMHEQPAGRVSSLCTRGYMLGSAESRVTTTFRRLEVFTEAAKDCNFRKTAERLGISQPSVSKQLRALELGTGKELFHRNRGTKPQLSAHGRVFLKQAQGVVQATRRLRGSAQCEVEAGPTRVRIAAGPYVLDNCIRPALPE